MMDSNKLCYYLTIILSWIYAANCQLLEMSPMDQIQLTSLVREIVHPQATPSLPMMAVASRHGGLPTTMAQMLEYTPYFVELATQMGVRPPGANNGTVSPQAMQNLMISRGAAWMQQQASLASMTGGALGLGSEMADFGGLLRSGMGNMGGMPFANTMQPIVSSHRGSTSGMGGFSPLSMMMLEGGLEMPQLALLHSAGMESPYMYMLMMQNML